MPRKETRHGEDMETEQLRGQQFPPERHFDKQQRHRTLRTALTARRKHSTNEQNEQKQQHGTLHTPRKETGHGEDTELEQRLGQRFPPDLNTPTSSSDTEHCEQH